MNPNQDSYQLEIRATVRRVGPHGEYRGSGEQLTVDHSLSLGTLDFLQLAGVLGRFHDLAEEVKRAHGEQERQGVGR